MAVTGVRIGIGRRNHKSRDQKGHGHQYVPEHHCEGHFVLLQKILNLERSH